MKKIEHPLYFLKCFICFDQGHVERATKICSLHSKPVCPKHAKGCEEDGHRAGDLEDQ
jgi:hypothetical protein